MSTPGKAGETLLSYFFKKIETVRKKLFNFVQLVAQPSAGSAPPTAQRSVDAVRRLFEELSPSKRDKANDALNTFQVRAASIHGRLVSLVTERIRNSPSASSVIILFFNLLVPPFGSSLIYHNSLRFSIMIPNVEEEPLFMDVWSERMSNVEREEVRVFSPGPQAEEEDEEETVSAGPSSRRRLPLHSVRRPKLNLTIIFSLMTAFKVYLEGTNGLNIEFQKLIDWIYTFNPNIRLELNRGFQTRSIELLFYAFRYT